MRGCAGKTTGSSSRERPVGDPREALGPDVGLSVHGGHDVRAGVVRRRHAFPGDRREAQRRVGHHVADDLGPTRHALAPKRLGRAPVGAEQQVGEPIDLDPCPLLGHREVTAPQPGLDVRDPDPRGMRRARARERRVRVAEHEDDVGPLGVDHPTQRGRQRVDVGGAQVEAVRRLGERELLEEDGRELVVPVLTGVDDDLVEARLAQRDGEGRRLDELRPVADDGEDLHGGQPRLWLAWPTPSSHHEQAYVDHAYTCLDRMRGLVERAADATDSEVAALALEAWAVKRFRTFEDAEQGLCFGRLDLETTPRPLYVGRRWVHDEESEPLVVNWQAPAARPFYVATPTDPHGVTLRRRFRTEGRRLLDLSDEWLDGSGSVAGGDFLLDELERSRAPHMRDIVATIQTDQYRLITRAPEPPLVIQGGPGTGKTAVGLHRASYLLYAHADTLRRVLVVGPNPAFMEYVSHVLPSLGEERVEQRAVTALVDGLDVTVGDAPETARLKGDLRVAEVIARAAAARSAARPGGARRPARRRVRPGPRAGGGRARRRGARGARSHDPGARALPDERPAPLLRGLRRAPRRAGLAGLRRGGASAQGEGLPQPLARAGLAGRVVRRRSSGPCSRSVPRSLLRAEGDPRRSRSNACSAVHAPASAGARATSPSSTRHARSSASRRAPSAT